METDTLVVYGPLNRCVCGGTLRLLLLKVAELELKLLIVCRCGCELFGDGTGGDGRVDGCVEVGNGVGVGLGSTTGVGSNGACIGDDEGSACTRMGA